MSGDLARALRRPGAGPALVTALGILVALVVLGFLGATLGALATTVQAELGPAFFAAIWSSQLGWALAGPLPIAAGVFLCFWQVAPIAPTLRLAHVVTRALLAGLAGAALLFVVALLVTVVGGLLAGELAVPVLPVLFASLATLVQVVPVLVLGAVLLWGWLQRHPPKVRVRGTLDEV